MAGYVISIRALPLLFPALISSLLIPTAYAKVNDSYLGYNCTNPNSPNTSTDLFTKLHDKAPWTNQLWTANWVNNSKYLLFRCRGDISTQDCQSCLSDAAVKLNDTCPNATEAIIWYDFCLLKYSQENFTGQIDTVNRFLSESQDNSTVQTYTNTAIELLKTLTSSIEPTNMFASGSAVVQGSVSVYGMVQCTTDITIENCTKCLSFAINHLPQIYENNKDGRRAFYGSCQLRYDNNTFLN